MKNRRFLVVGLGILGCAIAESLSKAGAEVIVVDNSDSLVEQLRDKVSVAVIGDATDRKVLEQVGADQVDGAIVCIGEHFEAAILATAHLLDLGVKHVAVRANSSVAESILRRMGAHSIFFVEQAMGEIIAHQFLNRSVEREMDLGGGYRVIQIKAPSFIHNKTLDELALPRQFNIQVIAIRDASGDGAVLRPTADARIQERQTLLLSGHHRDLERFLSKIE